MQQIGRFSELSAPAARRGFFLLAIMTLCFGLAMSIQENIVTNYFEDVLGLQGPQFGYITAIREVPGFLLIFLTAVFYRMSIPRLTSMMLVVLAVGYILFGLSNSFWTVAPWVVLSSMGYHTVLQTQYALGMSLTTERRSGSILGKMGAINSAGALVAMVLVFIVFYFDLLSFRPMFVIAGLFALIAAGAIYNFPNLHDGEERAFIGKRDPIVFRKPYKLYYYLSIFDGARQQIFFSFGLWVLALGLLIGIPMGWWYHVVLYRTLASRMALPFRWWRNPVELHPLLRPEEYRLVRPWLVTGALGFALCLTGGVAAIAGMLVMRFYP